MYTNITPAFRATQLPYFGQSDHCSLLLTPACAALRKTAALLVATITTCSSFQKDGFQNSKFKAKLNSEFSVSEHLLRIGLINSESQLPQVTLVMEMEKALPVECRSHDSPCQQKSSWSVNALFQLEDCFTDTQQGVCEKQDLTVFTEVVMESFAFCMGAVTVVKHIRGFPNQNPG